MASRDDRVIVVGGGIGGLGATRGLHRLGVPVTVFEQATELKEVGAGIQIWVDGMKALHEIGAAGDVVAHSGRLDRMEFRSWKGSALTVNKLAHLCQETGAASPVMIRRADLLTGLARTLPADTVQLESRCEGFTQDDKGVTVRFADGREERGSVLMAFDGLNSVVRRQEFGEAIAPRFAGYQYLRAVTYFDSPSFPRNQFSFTFGPGDRFGMGDVGGGWIYWFGVLLCPQENTQDGPEGRKGELQRRFRGFAEPVLGALESTPEEAILRNDIRDLPALPQWASGRVILAGDAAHAPTPNLGRGASMALVDGWLLSRRLAETRDLSDLDKVRAALAAFERERRPQTTKIQNFSWRFGSTANWSHPLMWRMRDAGMRAVMPRAMVKDSRREFAEYRLNTPAPAVRTGP
jgi:FAD-dependent urate hydroxylase